MSDKIIFPHNLLKSFILLYKNLPCLWDKECASYKIKQRRYDGIKKLTELVQTYDPTATPNHVLRKIDSLRTCVRREYRKVVESRRNAGSDDEVYTPQLWYYGLCSFIFTEEENELNVFKSLEDSEDEHYSNAESDVDDCDDDEEPEFDKFDSNLEHSYTDYNSGSIVDMPDSSKRFASFDEEKSKRHCTEIEDEYDAIGINVAAKLRNLPSNSRILAEKLINDVLYQAQTNALTSATIITTPDPFK